MTRITDLSPLDAAIAAAELAAKAGSRAYASASELLRAGIVNLDLLDTAIDHDPWFFTQLDIVRDEEARIDERTLVEHLGSVGARILIDDIDNLDLWLPVAVAVEEARNNVPVGNHRIRGPVTPDVMNEIVGSGRSPATALAIAQAAIAGGVAAGAFGFDTEITPALITALGAAGITSATALAEYRENGLTAGEAAELAARGAPIGAVVAAVASGLPREQWDETLARLPSRWFPHFPDAANPRHPIADGIMGFGATWDDVRKLVDGGWADADLRVFHGRPWKHDALGSVRIADALKLVGLGVTYDEAERWAKELSSGRTARTAYERSMPALLGRTGYVSGGTLLNCLTDLLNAGIKPTWLTEYRSSGARSVDDVLMLARAGITAKRSKELREAHAPKPRSGTRPRRFDNVRQALAAHAKATVAA